MNDYSSFLDIYGVTQDPETKEYIIVMQYAKNGSLLSYLDQSINKLTYMEDEITTFDEYCIIYEKYP